MTRSHSDTARLTHAATIEAWIVVFVVALTIWLLKSGILSTALESASDFGVLSGFVAGLLYSTFVTTPLAIGGFIALSETMPIWQIAVFGALGATIMDLILMREIRSPLSQLLVRAAIGHEVHAFRKATGFMRWVLAIFGGLLIAIPLPTDELGIIFLGASHLRALQLVPVIFVADLVGIYGFLEVLRAFT
ncbi:MAG TPA: hypothetical protein VJH91_01555 [Candidatus Paceibacterota bacterium]